LTQHKANDTPRRQNTLNQHEAKTPTPTRSQVAYAFKY